MDPYKARYAIDTDKRTLQEVLPGADIFLGLSAAGVLKPEYLKEMAENPLIMALANPTPEIMPDLAIEARPDAIIATGRSDYPNQVNNVLCFPFLFRGALDVGATQINEAMKMAAVRAIADLAMAEPSDIVRSAYGGQNIVFGREYLIPKPFDQRLMAYVAPAVAKAAMDSGVAQRPLESIKAYREKLHHSVFKTGMTMRPVFDSARAKARRVVYAEGEDEKVLQVVQQVVEQAIARPILIGRRAVIERRIQSLSLNVEIDEDFDLVDPQDHDDYFEYAEAYYNKVSRMGYSPIEARYFVRTNSTVLASLMISNHRADAMICGTRGRYADHLRHIQEVIGLSPGVSKMTSLNAIVMHAGTLFITDAYVQDDPDAADIAEIVRLCSQEVKWFGEKPRAALLSSSNFGTRNTPAAKKMREALQIIRARQPDLMIEGEMHADMALKLTGLKTRFPDTQLTESANLLVMPNQDAANISFNLLQTLADGTPIGPILVGAAESAHIVTPSITVRGLLNMTAVAAVRSH
jgi:malate dehydrogenase (oxaloacetate-decarboxylating)(NADP+)